MHFSFITLFPEIINSYCSYGVISKGIKKNLILCDTINPRDYAKNNIVDDAPFGGGAGVIMKPEPLYNAINAALINCTNKGILRKSSLIVYFSPTGKNIDQEAIDLLSKYEHLILIAGRYNGIDQRIRDNYIDIELSLGNYTISGGELPALILCDALARKVKGVLGDYSNYEQDKEGYHPPQYTRPKIFNGKMVPDVLLSGNHENILQWRLKQNLLKLLQNNPTAIMNNKEIIKNLISILLAK